MCIECVFYSGAANFLFVSKSSGRGGSGDCGQTVCWNRKIELETTVLCDGRSSGSARRRIHTGDRQLLYINCRGKNITEAVINGAQLLLTWNRREVSTDEDSQSSHLENLLMAARAAVSHFFGARYQLS